MQKRDSTGINPVAKARLPKDHLDSLANPIRRIFNALTGKRLKVGIAFSEMTTVHEFCQMKQIIQDLLNSSNR